jgi:hypothetical protein
MRSYQITTEKWKELSEPAKVEVLIKALGQLQMLDKALSTTTTQQEIRDIRSFLTLVIEVESVL